MLADFESKNSRWGISGRAALIAVAIHIVIIVALRKPVFHSHTLFVVNDTGAAIDSARVRDLIADRMLLTPHSGTVTFLKREGEIFMLRITRAGYAPVRVRLPNEVSESKPIVMRLEKEAAPR